MFKYNILTTFHCFTQYYKNKKKYYKLLYMIKKILFFCALCIKNVGLRTYSDVYYIGYSSDICSAFFLF